MQLSSARARVGAKGASGEATLAIGCAVSDLFGLLEQQQKVCP